MAWKYTSISMHPIFTPSSILLPKTKKFLLTHNFSPISSTVSVGTVAPALSEETQGGDGGITEDDSLVFSGGSSSSTRTQLDFLEQLTLNGSSASGYESDGNYRELTIRDQLAQLVGDRDDDFTIPLGKNIKKVTSKFLTVAQKRNIKRQAYLNEVSKRNDTVFFATIGAFVIFPPLIILGIAISAGYVQLFP